MNRQNMRKNEFRDPVEFEEGQLVLCRLISLEQFHYKTAFYKKQFPAGLFHIMLFEFCHLKNSHLPMLIDPKDA